MTKHIEPKTRGYSPDKHSALPYVDKRYKALLDAVADKQGRNKKKTTELAIEDYAEHYGFTVDKDGTIIGS